MFHSLRTSGFALVTKVKVGLPAHMLLAEAGPAECIYYTRSWNTCKKVNNIGAVGEGWQVPELRRSVQFHLVFCKLWDAYRRSHAILHTVQCSIILVSSATQYLFSLLCQSLQLCLIYGPMSKLDTDLLPRFFHGPLFTIYYR